MEQHEGKRYDNFMTEHERRVNFKDVRAYENADAVLNGKIVGLGCRDDRLKQQMIVYGGKNFEVPQQTTLEYENMVKPPKDYVNPHKKHYNKLVDKNQKSQIQMGAMHQMG